MQHTQRAEVTKKRINPRVDEDSEPYHQENMVIIESQVSGHHDK